MTKNTSFLPFFIQKWLRNFEKIKDLNQLQIKKKQVTYNEYYKSSRPSIAQKFIYAKSYKEMIEND